MALEDHIDLDYLEEIEKAQLLHCRPELRGRLGGQATLSKHGKEHSKKGEINGSKKSKPNGRST